MIETKWDYLFYSYKANLPLTKNYRNDLDKLHKAVNVIVESELKTKEKQGALEVLKQVVEEIRSCDTELEQEDLILEIEKRIKEFEGDKK